MQIWAHIWALQIWSSGVSLKRSCKMQFRCVDIRLIGPPSQKLSNLIFARFPHCNYNVHVLEKDIEEGDANSQIALKYC